MKKTNNILMIMCALACAHMQGSAQKAAASNMTHVNEQSNPFPVGVALTLPSGAQAQFTTTNNIGALNPGEYPVYFLFRNQKWIKVDLRGLKKPSSNLQLL